MSTKVTNQPREPRRFQVTGMFGSRTGSLRNAPRSPPSIGTSAVTAVGRREDAALHRSKWAYRIDTRTGRSSTKNAAPRSRRKGAGCRRFRARQLGDPLQRTRQGRA